AASPSPHASNAARITSSLVVVISPPVSGRTGSAQRVRIVVVLAPPRDAPVAQLADAHPFPLHDGAVRAPFGADRPLRQHDIADHREVMEVERQGPAPRERVPQQLRVLGSALDGSPGNAQHHVVGPAVEIAVEILGEPRHPAPGEDRAGIVERKRHGGNSSDASSVETEVTHPQSTPSANITQIPPPWTTPRTRSPR